MNIVEKLKNIPEGTKLYSPLFKEPVEFVKMNEGAPYPIICKTSVGELFVLTQEGYYTKETAPQNCMLFPTSEMTWEDYEYIPDGTLCVVNEQHFIHQIMSAKGGWYKSKAVNVHWIYFLDEHCLGSITDALYIKRLTIQEMEDVLKLLKKEGYEIVGNELRKIESKFKKGDIIASESTISIVDHVANLGSIENVIYYQACIDGLGKLHVKTDSGVGTVKGNHNATNGEKARILRMLAEAGYEFDGVNVIPKKHEFTPFEKVLVRDYDIHPWKCDFFSHPNEGFHYKFICTGKHYTQCIPFNNETAHLVGTTEMPPKKYIIWK